MNTKIRVIKRTDERSVKADEPRKAPTKENFRNWVADWRSGDRAQRRPSIKDLFPSQGT